MHGLVLGWNVIFLQSIVRILINLIHVTVTFFETTNDVVMCEAEVEPEMTDPAAVVSAVLSEAAHSEQPLIFSAHNIESYLAARQSAKESTEARVCFLVFRFGAGASCDL